MRSYTQRTSHPSIASIFPKLCDTVRVFDFRNYIVWICFQNSNANAPVNSTSTQTITQEAQEEIQDHNQDTLSDFLQQINRISELLCTIYVS